MPRSPSIWRTLVAPNRPRGFDPFLRSEGKAIQAGLVSKGFEFETFKSRVMNLFPDTNEFESVAVTHPAINQHIVAELLRHVGQGDEIGGGMGNHGYGRPLDIDGAFLGFAHGWTLAEQNSRLASSGWAWTS